VIPQNSTAPDMLGKAAMDSEKAQLGQLLDAMIRTLSARRHAPMSETHRAIGDELGVKSDAVYKWRQGASSPNSQALARLVEMGVAEAGMDRKWAEQVLSLAHHPDRSILLARLFVPAPPQAGGVRHNLPRRRFARLPGRDGELDEVWQRLAPHVRSYIIPIEGIGGIGKTALALEIASRLVEEHDQLPVGRRFDAIVWLSAKQQQLDERGVTVRPRLVVRSLDEVLQTIEQVVLDRDLSRRPQLERAHAIDAALRRPARVLLVIDGLDDLDDLDEPHLSDVLGFLRDLPPPSKAIVTARFHEDLPEPLHLSGLANEPMAELLRDVAHARRLPLTDEQVGELIRAAGGVPQVAHGLLAAMALRGLSSDEVREPAALAGTPFVHNLFGGLREQLGPDEPDAMRVLHVLTFFDPHAGATAEAVCQITRLDAPICRHMLHLLSSHNFVQIKGEGREPRFATIAFVGTQAGAELREDVQQAERRQWIAYYLQLTARHRAAPPDTPPANYDPADHDLPGYSLAGYDLIEREWPNLRLVFEWCATQDAQHRMEQGEGASHLKQFWLEDRVSTFADIRGYWEDRHRWLGWLSQAAAWRQDWSTAVAALVPAAQSTVLLERYDEAEEELVRALEWRDYASASLVCELLNIWVLLALRRRDLVAAREWLAALEAALAHGELDAVQRSHQQIDAAYFHGRVHLLEGAPEKAASAFQRMLQLCQQEPRRWVRERAYAHNALAEVAIKDGQLEQAEIWLEEAAAFAEQCRDRRLLASLKRTRAALWHRQGQLKRARQLISAAQREFNQLGMKQEAAETPDCVAALADR